jgi:hypothetical protein
MVTHNQTFSIQVAYQSFIAVFGLRFILFWPSLSADRQTLQANKKISKMKSIFIYFLVGLQLLQFSLATDTGSAAIGSCVIFGLLYVDRM